MEFQQPAGRAFTHPRRGRSAVLAVLLLASCLTAVLRTTPAHADTVTDENRFVELINAARVAGGLKPLAVHPALIDAARGWATKMRAASQAAGTTGCLISHNPDLRTAVAANWRKLGENVGCGDVDADYLHQKFMDSPAHKANIMDPEFDSIGIGIVMTDGGVMFVTEQFMTLDTRTAPTTAAPPPSALALQPSASVKGTTVVPAPVKTVKTVKKKTVKTVKKK